MNDLIPQNFGALSSVFAGAGMSDDLSAGVQGGFGHIGYRGKTWSVRYRGEELPLMRSDGTGPQNHIDLVILKAPQVVSKIYYEGKWVEGTNQAPDCWSTNGMTPDVAATRKQAASCAACPKNVWGSKITDQGKPGKACQDSKRLAVVPLADIRNVAFGGPMLLRVPAASLADLANFGQKLAHMGLPYYAIAIQIQFDIKEAYPKFVFRALRQLSDDEGRIVLEMRDSPEVSRILAEDVATASAPMMLPQAAFDQVAAPTPQPAPQQVQSWPKPTPQPAPQPQPSVNGTGTAFTTPAHTANGVAGGRATAFQQSSSNEQSGLETGQGLANKNGGGAFAAPPLQPTQQQQPTQSSAFISSSPPGNSFEDELDKMCDELLPK